jgi:predicted aldo/keto reductase-like oxidoreductase
MRYRTMKKSDQALSILGFGCMRFPQTPAGRIDENAATAMLRAAIDGGVNYLDTAYVYHDGESEPFLGRALRGGYRERVQLATKLPVWRVRSREDMDRYLDEQLRRLRTDHIDFYLLHGLVRKSWDRAADLGACEFLDEALADGRIRHAGFSFHDRVTVFKDIVDEYDWSFCQIQYNYMDEDYQAGTEGLRYAAEKGLGIIVMEPLRGGMLAKEAPGAREIRAASGSVRTPAEWGLCWVWNHPEVTVVLSGMSTMEQVRQNLGYADAGLPGSLTDAELAVYGEIRGLYRSRVAIPCTGCRYCMPCHSGVDIPACFAIYNDAFIYDDVGSAKFAYDVFTGFGGAASQCQDCGVCEDLCPQRIPIREMLQEVARLFGK